MKNIALVYMAGGISSRFGGIIKQLAIVGPSNETLLEYSMKQALINQFCEVILMVGDKTEGPIKAKFGDNYMDRSIRYIKQSYNPDERDRPWGTADVIALLDSYKSDKQIDNFVICNSDDIYGVNTFKQLFNEIQCCNTCLTIGYPLITTIPNIGNVNRGVFDIQDDGYVRRITEIFDISSSDLKGYDKLTIASANIFGIDKNTISLIKQKNDIFKENYKGNRKTESLLPTTISDLIEENKIKLKALMSMDEFIGITNPGDEIIVKQKLLNM